MTQEEKELLLKDLCARLPYGVKVKSSRRRESVTLSLDVMIDFHLGCSVKPYLRPMSSITEEERKAFDFMLGGDRMNYVLFDWLNKKKFDYRGLIPKGLALEAPEGMYNTKTE